VASGLIGWNQPPSCLPQSMSRVSLSSGQTSARNSSTSPVVFAGTFEAATSAVALQRAESLNLNKRRASVGSFQPPNPFCATRSIAEQTRKPVHPCSFERFRESEDRRPGPRQDTASKCFRSDALARESVNSALTSVLIQFDTTIWFCARAARSPFSERR
jgi:hypothetical protein